MKTENIQDEENHHYSEERDSRVKETAEVFTPDSLIQEMLDTLGVDWENPPQNKNFIDPTCGSGNFLIALAKRGIPLKNIYGVDLMQDNIDKTKERLTEFFSGNMNEEDIIFHLDRNIICDDALTYHYEFWWYIPDAEISDNEW